MGREPTASFSKQLKEMPAAWDPVFNRFAGAPPDVSAFLACGPASFGASPADNTLSCVSRRLDCCVSL